MTILKILTRIYFIEKCLEIIFSTVKGNFSSSNDVNNKYINDCYELWTKYNEIRKVTPPGGFSEYVKAFKLYYSIFGERIKHSGGMTYMFNQELLIKRIKDLENTKITAY